MTILRSTMLDRPVNSGATQFSCALLRRICISAASMACRKRPVSGNAETQKRKQRGKTMVRES
jgi:hypothetical protein